MTHPNLDAARALEQLMADQAARYEHAIALAVTCQRAHDERETMDREIETFQNQIAQIKIADHDLRQAQNQWQRAGAIGNAGLRAVRDRLATLIEELIGHVDKMESLTRVARDQLSPQLTLEARGRQMAAAYRAGSMVD